jgi:hypothetical protein
MNVRSLIPAKSFRSERRFLAALTAVVVVFNLGAAENASPNGRELEVSKLTPTEKRAFTDMSPKPVRVFATFGIGAEGKPGELYYNAHPESRLWFKPQSGPRQITARYRIIDAAWKDVPVGDATDGVLFRIVEIKSDGSQKVILERLLKPRQTAADRGVQEFKADVELAPGSEVLFETTPGPAKQFSRDWAGWGKIEIR